MKRRRFIEGLITSLLGAAGCMDPAALDVVIDINAPGLEALGLVVKSDGFDGPAFVDCRLTLGASADASCGFEGGTGRWADPTTASFVLFGSPGDAVAVEVDGFRAGRSVTATRAEARLPPRVGERSTLRLALFDRTEARCRCAIDVPTPPGVVEPSLTADTQTGLTAADLSRRAGLELLLSVDGELLVATFTPGAADCSLDVTAIRDPDEDRQDPFHPDRWCRVHPGSLVVGPAIGGGRVAASLCARPHLGGARLKVAVVQGSVVDIRTIDLAVPLSQVTVPVLVDLDGDGGVEVVALLQDSATPPAEVRLVRHDPGPNSTASFRIGAYAGLGRDRPGLSPLVVGAAASPEQLVVIGYPGPIGVFSGNGFAMLATAGVRGSRGPTILELDDGLWAQELRGQLVLSSRLSRDAADAAWRVVATETAVLSQPILPDDLVRASVGVSATGAPLVGFVQDGAIFAWSPVAPAPRRLDTLSAAAGSQALLHVNLDGAPGTELVFYAPDANLVRAVNQAGRPLLGWPLTLTGESGTRRVLITDLEGRDAARPLRSAEVVALTYRHLEVISLGAGSYDPAAWPWPTVEGDAQGRGRFAGARDPLRR